MNTAYVGVSSNVSPQENILKALSLVSNHLKINGTSTFYRTCPLGSQKQDDYLNGVWQISTELPPKETKHITNSIEVQLGRIKTENKYAPRPIDLDLLLYENMVIDEAAMTLPDPDIAKRNFLIFPLLELNPKLILPPSQTSLASLSKEMSKSGMTPLEGFTQKIREAIDTSP